MWIPRGAALLALLAGLGESPALAISLKEAVTHAVETHPSVMAARANQNATAFEMLQAKGRFMPTVDMDANIGWQKIDQPEAFDPARNDEWRSPRQVAVTVRQILFDGFDRANDLYKSAARIDAAALRVLQRSESQALQAIEAYIDVQRHVELTGIAKRNVQRHHQILGLVRELVQGGKAPNSDVGQTQERVYAAEAVAAQVEQALLEAQAKFRQAVGLEPKALSDVRPATNLPPSREDAVRLALAENPAILAAGADTDVARFAFDQADSKYWPTVSLEGRASHGENIDGTPGLDNELLGRVVVTWNLFDGNIKKNIRRELSARVSQAYYEQAVKAKETGEAVERAYAAYSVGAERVFIVREQVMANEDVVKAYSEEYKLSKRSLLDLLDAEAALFNSRFQLVSLEAVRAFSSFQVLGSMGTLLNYFGVSAPPEAAAIYRENAKQGVFDVYIQPLNPLDLPKP